MDHSTRPGGSIRHLHNCSISIVHILIHIFISHYIDPCDYITYLHSLLIRHPQNKASESHQMHLYNYASDSLISFAHASACHGMLSFLARWIYIIGIDITDLEYANNHATNAEYIIMLIIYNWSFSVDTHCQFADVYDNTL